MWLRSIEQQISGGDWRPPERARETFGAYGKRWLDHRPDLGPSSAERYERLWRLWLKPAFGDVPLGAMTPEGWRTWFTEASSAHPGSTQPSAAYRLARAILNTAVDDELIRANPCRVKNAGRSQPPERPIVTPDEVLKIRGGDRRPIQGPSPPGRLVLLPVRRVGGTATGPGRPSASHNPG